jgi:hypothetical protein
VLVTVIEQHLGPVVLRSSAEASQYRRQKTGVHVDAMLTGQQVVVLAELAIIAITLQSNARQAWGRAGLELLE